MLDIRKTESFPIKHKYDAKFLINMLNLILFKIKVL